MVNTNYSHAIFKHYYCSLVLNAGFTVFTWDFKKGFATEIWGATSHQGFLYLCDYD